MYLRVSDFEFAIIEVVSIQEIINYIGSTGVSESAFLFSFSQSRYEIVKLMYNILRTF